MFPTNNESGARFFCSKQLYHMSTVDFGRHHVQAIQDMKGRFKNHMRLNAGGLNSFDLCLAFADSALYLT